MKNVTAISVQGLTEDAKVALIERGIPFERCVHSTRHTYRVWWEINFPQGTVEGGNGFQHEDVPSEYDPYYRQGPTIGDTIRFFQLPDGVVFIYEIGGELEVYEGELPSYTSDGHFKTWAKSSPFAQWQIIEDSPYARSFLANWESNSDLRRQPYAQNIYNHIMQPNPCLHVEMVL